MEIIRRLYGKLNIVVVRYADAENYDCRTMRYVRKGDELEMEPGNDAPGNRSKAACPAILLVCGYGVITKECREGDGIAERITSRPGDFIWSGSGENGAISFIRREQIAKAIEELGSKEIKPIAVVCCTAGEAEDEVFIREAAAACGNITLRNILKPGDAGSVLSMYLFRKLRMSVLAAMLALLVVNVLVDRCIGDRYSAANTELMALRRKIGRAQDESKLLSQTIAGFGHTLPYGYAAISDAIGAAVPPSVTLTHLDIQPLRKKLETGKRPDIILGEVVIRGEAARSEDVSAFVEALNDTWISGAVKLSSVERNKEGTMSLFQINMKL